MAKRRRLRGKKLLVVSGALAGASLFASCSDDATANLIAPPDTGSMDSSADGGDGSTDTSTGDTSTTDTGAGDATPDTTIPFDAVANLIAPPDVGIDGGDGGDAS